MAPGPLEPPTWETFREIVNSGDPIRLTIDGHKAIDAALTALMAESLPDPDLPELSRLKFTTRLDLVIALGLLPRESRPGWLEFNRLRNRMAHEIGAEVDEAASRRVFAALGARHREMLGNTAFENWGDPVSPLMRCLAVLYAEATNRLTALRDDRTRELALHEMVEAAIAPADVIEPYQRARTSIIEAKVEQARRQRDRQGKY